MPLDSASTSIDSNRTRIPAKFTTSSQRHVIGSNFASSIPILVSNKMAQKLSLQARRWRTIIVTLPVMAATSRS